MGCGVGCGMVASAERYDRNCDTAWRRLPSEAPPLAFQGKHDSSWRSFVALLQGTGLPLTTSVTLVGALGRPSQKGAVGEDEWVGRYQVDADSQCVH